MSQQSECARLLYWADLPVNPTVAGATLIHRLLEAWPAEKLMVVTPDAVNGCCLPGVRTVEPPPSKFARLWYTRFALHAMSLSTLLQMAAMRSRGGAPPRWLRKSVDEFRPEAVLTVGIAGAWIHATGLARNLRIPLHMMVHDDHHYSYFWLPRLRAFGERIFGDAYRQSVSRLCVSQPMCEEYKRRFDAEGEVLLPSRGRDAVFFTEPAPRVGLPLAHAKVFYAGSLPGAGFQAMDDFAVALQSKGHRLIVYTPTKPAKDFRPRALEIRAPLPSGDLVRALREEADLLLLRFAPEDRQMTTLGFPSKIVDYTAVAAPVLVVAPEYACIVEYLRQRPDAAHLAKSERASDVLAAVEELVGDSAKRQALARGAVAASQDDFSYEKAWKQFAAAMGRGRPQRRDGTSSE